MKRFTETRKWEDPWFRELSPDAKLVWWFITEKCDNAGVWDPDYAMVNFCIKRDVDWESVLAEFGDRVKKIRGGKWWITRFVLFQCGELREACPPHKMIIALLGKHGISVNDPWITGEAYSEMEVPLPPRPAKHATAELPGLERPRPGRAADLIFEALAAVTGIDLKRLTPSARAKLNKATSEIRGAEPDVTPERIQIAAKAWPKKYKDATMTAMAIASHWSELTPAKPSAEQIAARKKMQADLADHEASLAKLLTTHPDSGQNIPFGHATAEDLAEIRRLQGLIDGIKKALK